MLRRYAVFGELCYGCYGTDGTGAVGEIERGGFEHCVQVFQFLLENRAKELRVPLDFSKYDTATHVWNEDAQEFVNGIRRDDRF